MKLIRPLAVALFTLLAFPLYKPVAERTLNKERDTQTLRLRNSLKIKASVTKAPSKQSLRDIQVSARV
jgi:hypothetical protein